MKNSIALYHWLPRILCILAILFISLFAADSFDNPEQTIWQQLGGFFIHLIPSIILLLFLIVAWKRELIGGIIFIVIGIVLSPLVFMLYYNRNHSVWMSLTVILFITLPFLLVGILFLVSHRKKKKAAKVEKFAENNQSEA